MRFIALVLAIGVVACGSDDDTPAALDPSPPTGCNNSLEAQQMALPGEQSCRPVLDYGGRGVGSSDATIDRSIVRDNAEPVLGDGILSASFYGEPASVAITSSIVENHARAGVSSFGASVTLRGSRLTCNDIHLNGDPYEGPDFSFRAGRAISASRHPADHNTDSDRQSRRDERRASKVAANLLLEDAVTGSPARCDGRGHHIGGVIVAERAERPLAPAMHGRTGARTQVRA